MYTSGEVDSSICEVFKVTAKKNIWLAFFVDMVYVQCTPIKVALADNLSMI